MEDILKKLDKIDEKLGSIDRTLIKQEENLKLHMYRTELAEANLTLLRRHVDNETTKITERIEPIQVHVVQVQGIAKLLSILATAVAILAGLWRLF
jgi:uncharacterized protein YPO0396